MNPKVLTIIPARGGSKRFPGKNIHPLCGFPLISYVINAAKKAKTISRVVVSTDDQKIADVALSCGAEVPFLRPKNLAHDNSSVIDALVYTVKRFEEEDGYKPDYILLLQPTNPLVAPEQIDGVVDLALEKSAESVVAVCRIDTPSHPYNIRLVDQDFRMKFWQEELHYKDIGKQRPGFYKAANIWLSSYNTLIHEGRIEGKNNFAYCVNSISALDIDYREDLDLIEAWLNYRQTNG
jgi:CMP-N-acetylneuraminic acid synthetase